MIFYEFLNIFLTLYHISALKSHGKSATFRQHYYPEGGWGWVITFCCYMVNIFTTGLQMSFGLILPEIVKHCQNNESKPNTSTVNVGKRSEFINFI